MYLLKGVNEGTKPSITFDCYAATHGVTTKDVESWLAETDNLPTFYYEDNDEQIDVDRWSDNTAIFTADGEYADPTQFKEGDILDLLDIPFDKDGRHATGWAIWQKAAAGNYCWVNEYEEVE